MLGIGADRAEIVNADTPPGGPQAAAGPGGTYPAQIFSHLTACTLLNTCFKCSKSRGGDLESGVQTGVHVACLGLFWPKVVYNLPS